MAILEGGVSGNIAEVDSNKNLKVNLPTGQTQAGYASIIFENDAGTLFGTKRVGVPFVTYDRRLSVGIDTPYFDYTFNATAQDTGVWRHVTATMTTTWGTTGMLLNASLTTTTTTGTAVSSWRTFPLTANGTMVVDMTLLMTDTIVANQVVEFGLFPFGAGTAAPTEGAYFRFTNAGLIGVLNFNAVETTSAVMLSVGAITINQAYQYSIKIHERVVSFWRDGVLLANGEITIPAAQGQPFITTQLPLTFQFRNSGAASGTLAATKILDAAVDQKSLNLGKPYQHIQAGKGLMAYQGTNGGTMGTTALYSNSLAAGAGVVMTNTTAALGNGLGGQFTTTATLAAGTDGIVCNFAVPAGSVNQTPRMLYITGVRVQSAVVSNLTGGPLLWAYSLAFGHSNLNLTTAEAIAAKASRRIALGFETIPVTSIAGVVGAGVYVAFNSPVVVAPNENIALVAKNLGTVASAGAVTFLVFFDGYWE